MERIRKSPCCRIYILMTYYLWFEESLGFEKCEKFEYDVLKWIREIEDLEIWTFWRCMNILFFFFRWKRFGNLTILTFYEYFRILKISLRLEIWSFLWEENHLQLFASSLKSIARIYVCILGFANSQPYV